MNNTRGSCRLTRPGGQGEKKTTYVYAGGAACITEYDSTISEGATRERWFVHGPGFPDPLVMVDLTAMGDVAAVGQPGGGEEFLYYLKDLLGSVTALANSNGAVVERYVYDPYGKTTIETAGFYHDADLDGDVDEEDDSHFDACWLSSDPLCVFVHDRNGDNIVDGTDLGLFAGCYTTNGVAPGPECARWSAAYFDPDGDGEVTLHDFGGFQDCFGATDDLCLFVCDEDGDADVDLDDYVEFNAHIGTSGVPHPVVADGSRYGNPFLWTGQRYDGSVGLYHFLFRSYSPNLGRWLQRDPLGYVDGANLYEYVGSSPLSWIDPEGLKKKKKKCKRGGWSILDRSFRVEVTTNTSNHRLQSPAGLDVTVAFAESIAAKETITKIDIYDHGTSGIQGVGKDGIELFESRWNKLDSFVKTPSVLDAWPGICYVRIGVTL